MKKWLIAGMLLAIATTGSAVTTEIFRFNSFEDFLTGQAREVEISAEGYITPGPALERQALKLPAVWSCLAHSNGRNFVGAGNSGKIFMKDGKSWREVLDTKGLAVTALVEGHSGVIYASAVPGGKIFQLNSDGSQGNEWAKVPDAYIWTMVMGKDGNLYAGTGPNGHIYSISQKGDVTALMATRNDQVTRLILDGKGGILAGTSKGVLYRVEGKSVKVLTSYPRQEISALALARDGQIWIALNSVQVRARPPQAIRAPEVKKEGEEPDDDSQMGRPADEGGGGGERQRSNLTLVLFRQEGTQRLILRAGGLFATDLASFSDGSVLLATGSRGRIFRLDDDNHASLWTDMKESVVTTITLRGSKVALIGVANAGGVYEVAGRASQNASFISKALDANFISTWGRMSWKAEGKARVETRSGNVENPEDKTWSGWQELSNGELVKSPPARYLQFRVQWSKSEARVSDIRIAYRPSNQPPAMIGVMVKAGGKANRSAGPAGSGDQEQQQAQSQESVSENTGFALIQWKADNPDSDELIYFVEFRKEGDTAWVPLTPDGTHQTRYRWDTSVVPDGWYRVRVMATDKKSNPPAKDLSDSLTSAPLLIDNSRPDARNLKVDRNNTATGVAVDSFSRIAQIEYSLDGGPWTMIWPDDGIFDEREESFTIKLGALKAGVHKLTVTTLDEGGNEGVAGVTFNVK